MDSRSPHWLPDRALVPTRWAFALSALATVGAWLLSARGSGLPLTANRGLALAALAAGLAWLALATVRRWRREPGEPVVTPGRVLIVLTLLSLGVRWTGIQFELIDHYYNDEGVFYAMAVRINQGDLLPDTFNYGHFLYYASALTIWLQDLFPQLTATLVEFFFGYEAPEEVALLLLRGLTATLGALTTIPVFIVGLRVAGPLAGALGGALILFSPLYNEVSQLTISDVPSAFFATLTLMFVANLLEGENWRDYLLAGVSAGLAAGSKYPGGVVAVAIIGVWVYWRIRSRRWSWHLLAAGLVSMIAFLAIMPALWMNSGTAFSGSGLDITFGWRQYARSGWIGTMPTSNLGWYSGQILHSFGIASLVIGLSGLLVLPANGRRRLLAILPYPLVYLWLIVSMNMVVRRNLQPVLPALAAVLGVGVAAWGYRLLRSKRLPGRYAVAVLCLVSLLGPTVRTVASDISRTRPGTRQLAKAFIEENYPWGTGVIHEAYAPGLSRHHNYRLGNRSAAAFKMEDIRSGLWDLVILTPKAYQRFFEEQRGDRPWVEDFRQRYETMFSFPLEKEFRPSLFRAGPPLYIYRIDPEEILYATQRTFTAQDVAFTSHPSIKSDDGADVLRFERKGRSVLFKDYFEPGTYEIELRGDFESAAGRLFVYSRDNEEVAAIRKLAVTRTVELPRKGKYFFRLFLKPPGKLTEFTVSRRPR